MKIPFVSWTNGAKKNMKFYWKLSWCVFFPLLNIFENKFKWNEKISPFYEEEKKKPNIYYSGAQPCSSELKWKNIYHAAFNAASNAYMQWT